MPVTAALRAIAHRLPPSLRRLARPARRWFPSPESVILFAFSDLVLAADLRREHDRSARVGMPPHITLIYPFIEPSEIESQDIEKLRSYFRSIDGFTLRLAGMAGFPGVIYLLPEPGDELVEIVEGLVRLFPQTPPYRGAFETIIPHLTVIESFERTVQDAVMAATVRDLPLDLEVTEACLMVRSGRRWAVRDRFTLGVRVPEDRRLPLEVAS